MNIIYIDHGNGKDFIFRVSDEMVKHVHKGDTVVTETMYGIATGVCKTDVVKIHNDDAVYFARTHGAYLPFKHIIGKLYPELEGIVIRNMLDRLMKSKNDDLPF